MMPHVDEGTLHALLDGALRAEAPERAAGVRAHIAACEDCRARLEAAEELRGEAAGILAAAGPVHAEATPDFSDVVARAADRETGGSGAAGAGAARTARIRQGTRRMRAVAWAASLVLALGTGYLLRDLAGPGTAGSAFDAVRSEATTDRETATPRAGDPATLHEEAESPAPGGTAGERAPAPVAVPADEAANARALRQEPAPQTPEPAPSAEPEADREASGAAGGARSAEDTGAGDARDAGAGDARAADAGAANAGAPPPVPAPPPTPRPEPRSGGVAPPPGESAQEETGAPADRKAADLQTSAAVASARGERVVPAGAAAGDSVRWSTISLAEARAALDGPLFVLPHAELLEIYILAGGAPGRVMTLQRLQTGIPVQVVQWPGGEAELDVGEATAGVPTRRDPATPLMDSALPGAEVARVIRGGYILELTGSLPSSLLAVLGETARPAP